jgi:transposase
MARACCAEEGRMTGELFADLTGEGAPVQEPRTVREHARVIRPVRGQIELIPRDLESLLPEDHPARAIWETLERLDLARFYEHIKAVVDRPGHPASDPQVLLGLWLLGTVQGVGSARQLARLCTEHDAYRWMAGGVPINYHLLSDFRANHGEALDDLLTQIVASLIAVKAVTLERVAQDGMRVRASAGAASYRRADRLADCLKLARHQVETLAHQREHPDPGGNTRQRAARERAARERLARVEQAVKSLPALQETKDRQRKANSIALRAKVTEPRASTTDPDARVMKMADGGFRPAFNVELATDATHGVIVGVRVVNEGTDAAQAPPMEEQVARRTGRHPTDYLVDGGFATREAITTLTQRGVTVYAPVRLPKSKPEEERYQPRYRDTLEVIAWRERMATDEAKAIYRERGATAEWVNAQFRVRHHVERLTVRGLAKVTTLMVLVAVAHNLLRWLTLGPAIVA